MLLNRDEEDSYSLILASLKHWGLGVESLGSGLAPFGCWSKVWHKVEDCSKFHPVANGPEGAIRPAGDYQCSGIPFPLPCNHEDGSSRSNMADILFSSEGAST